MNMQILFNTIEFAIWKSEYFIIWKWQVQNLVVVC